MIDFCCFINDFLVKNTIYPKKEKMLFFWTSRFFKQIQNPLVTNP